MNEDVLLRLAIAKQHAHHANFAGTLREAIADGYSAVDAMLSALPIHKGVHRVQDGRSKNLRFNLLRLVSNSAANSTLRS